MYNGLQYEKASVVDLIIMNTVADWACLDCLMFSSPHVIYFFVCSFGSINISSLEHYIGNKNGS